MKNCGVPTDVGTDLFILLVNTTCELYPSKYRRK